MSHTFSSEMEDGVSHEAGIGNKTNLLRPHGDLLFCPTAVAVRQLSVDEGQVSSRKVPPNILIFSLSLLSIHSSMQ